MTSSSSAANNPASHAMYDATRKRRRGKRHGRTGEVEVKDLNITPMMDMMTILLVFLLKSFASSSSNVNVANLVLPYSTTKLEVGEALQLMISQEAILVDQKVVTNLQGGQIDPEDLPDGPEGFLIQPLYDALDARAQHFKRIAEFGGATFEGRVAIIADRKLPYSVLFRVLYTCGRAEFGRFNLFVQKNE